jgi:hypothetical protein
LPGEDKKALIEQLKREIAKLEDEENLLRKRDERLRWEQEMLEKTAGKKIPETAEKITVEVDAPPTELEPGTTYILFESKPQKAMSLFMSQIKKEKEGLFITRVNPNQIRSQYDLGKSKVYWLTSVKSTDDTPSVSGLQELSILISNQVDQNNKSAILLDGVEYLVSNNDFSIVLRLIQQIRDKVSTTDSLMIIPLNEKALEPKQVILLERECTKI